MDEIGLALKCDRTIRKRALCMLKCRSKCTLFLRCFVFLCLILIYFIRFLLTTNLKEGPHQVFSDFSPPQHGRKLLGFQPNDADSIPPTLENCTAPSILEFPTDGLTREERQHGWILLHVLVSLYCFLLLAIVCDDYFVPAIEQICLHSKIQKDVIGATLMAAATASPELFMNCVGTFVTKGDIGVGTTVGAAVFNVLAVPACCGLLIGRYVQLDWWPLSRDCLMYCLAVVALIVTLSDGKIMWYEALGLVVSYFFYMAVMYYNDQLALIARGITSRCYRLITPRRVYKEVSELTPLVRSNNNNNNSDGNKYSQVNISMSQDTLDIVERCPISTINKECDYADSPWQRAGRCWPAFLLRWPITLILWLTIPDSRRHTKCKYLTLLLCVTWIGVMSYLISYVIIVIGDSLDIPDSVMGLTILAAGMSMPDAISSIIVTKQGQGAMAISNAIGSNTFDILLCLGLPWLIKSFFLPTNPNEKWITLNSTGFIYSAVLLLVTLFGLFMALSANRFVLDWKVGLGCTIMYIGFMVTASMIELNFFFPVNLPVCRH